MLKNQIYIPVPDEISQNFLPADVGKKRFEIRFELLYPEFREEIADDDAQV